MSIVPINVPTVNLSELVGKRNSEVKIYIPKVRNSKGILVPTAEVGKYWYVYCYFRNPKTGKLNHKYIVKGGINTFKTVKERKAASKIVKLALEQLISEGFSPFERFEENTTTDIKHFYTAKEAIVKAKRIKSKQWGSSSLSSAKSHVSKFLEFLSKHHLDTTNIKDIRKKHVAEFLNQLNLSNKSRNNYRATISSLFAQLVADDIIDHNIVAAIPVLKVKPNKNKAYTSQQIKMIRTYLIKNDPYLLQYLQFVTYAFLRPIEVNRLKVGDIDIENRRITVKTKTSTSETILIIAKLEEIITKMNLKTYDDTYFLFTKEQKPSIWITKTEKQRQEWFMKRFRKVKEYFNFGPEYSMYSFRHSFALNLYNKFIKDGLTDLEAKHKLMTITRHKSLSGLENYLRDIGAFVPADYSDDFTIEF